MARQQLDRAKWTAERATLNNAYKYKPWKEIIKLFKDRVKDFYFEPINRILLVDQRKGEGFSILTLQCALIEMFAAFRTGQIHNHKKPKKGIKKPTYEYNMSDECFIKFLETEDIFQDHFFTVDEVSNQKIPNPNCSAKDFYSKVRSGLMHEARTKEDWLITAASPELGYPNRFITIDPKNNNKKVNRSILQTRLEHYFKNYIKELSAEDESGEKLRRFLGRKLDHMHDFPPDLKYDWWHE